MANRNVTVEEATDAELKDFATTILQLEIKPEATRAEIMAAITKVWKQPHIIVSGEDPVDFDGEQIERAKPEAKVLGAVGKYKDDPLVELEIGNTGYVGGEEPASVSVNGSPNLVIQRGMRVKIPYRFYLALRDAHQVEVKQNLETRVMTENKISNYPMTIYSMPSKADIAAWDKRVRDLVLG